MPRSCPPPSTVSKARGLIAFGLLVLSTVAWAQSAMADLRRNLDNQLRVAGVFVQERQLGNGETGTLKVQVTPSRVVVAIVLQPISLAGIVSIDDGRDVRTYMPDSKVLRVQSSSRRFIQPIDERMRLIARNYRVRYGVDTVMAGRPSRQIVVTPKDSRLPIRRLTFDRDRFTVLRYELIEGDRVRKILDTISVKYCDDEASQALGIPGVRDLRLVRDWGPRPVERPNDTRALAGFSARTPSNLPSGFIVHTIHLVGTEESPFVALRLTDGMSDVTIYQWRAAAFPDGQPFRTATIREDSYGVRFAARGDVSSIVLRDILDRFAPSRPAQ